MRHWAFWHDSDGGAHVRPLFEGEPRGHGYTGPLKAGETEIEVTDGAYPDKVALSTQAKRDQMAKEKAEREKPPLTRPDVEAMIQQALKR